MFENPKNQFDADWEEKVNAHFAGSVPKPLPEHNTTVTGYVVANAPFGIFVDIGYGVPALLDNIHIAHEHPENMYPHWTKPIGSRICAKVGDHSGQFLKLHQWEYEQWGQRQLMDEA